MWTDSFFCYFISTEDSYHRQFGNFINEKQTYVDRVQSYDDIK